MILQISANTDPFELFGQWFSAAEQSGVIEPNAMTVATANEEGDVFARIVLMKIFDAKGFCFFTNYKSHKGRQLVENPKGAFCFHWRKPEHRQIRMTGPLLPTTAEESQAYFATRPRGSQIAAWASPQSQVVPDREALEQRLLEVEKRFQDQEISCPPHWGGYCLNPLVMEFWQEQEFRRHDRFRFQRTEQNGAWTMDRLAP